MAKSNFIRINGWSYKTRDNQFMISHTGADRCWFSAKIDAEQSTRFGWEIADEFSKVYHTSLREAMNWVEAIEIYSCTDCDWKFSGSLLEAMGKNIKHYIANHNEQKVGA